MENKKTILIHKMRDVYFKVNFALTCTNQPVLYIFRTKLWWLIRTSLLFSLELKMIHKIYMQLEIPIENQKDTITECASYDVLVLHMFKAENQVNILLFKGAACTMHWSESRSCYVIEVEDWYVRWATVFFADACCSNKKLQQDLFTFSKN